MHNSNFKLKVIKTKDLIDKEIEEIVELINLVFYFEKKIIPNPITKENFYKKFLNNCMNNSYHGVVIKNNKIITCYSVIPIEYFYFKKKYIFGLAVDTLTHPDFRGNLSNFKQIANKVYNELIKDDIPFIFGFPNKNIQKIRERILKWENISNLKIYANFVDITNLKFFERKKSKFILNIIIKYYFIFSKILSFLDSRKLIYRPIHSKYNIDFHLNKKPLEKIIKSKKNKIKFHYNIYNDDRIEGKSTILYLLNVFPFSLKNLSLSISELLNIHKEVEIILFASNLKFFVHNLIPIPQKLSPNIFKAQGLILNSKVIDKRVFNGSNWFLDFSSFDIR